MEDAKKGHGLAQLRNGLESAEERHQSRRSPCTETVNMRSKQTEAEIPSYVVPIEENNRKMKNRVGNS